MAAKKKSKKINHMSLDDIHEKMAWIRRSSGDQNQSHYFRELLMQVGILLDKKIKGKGTVNAAS